MKIQMINIKTPITKSNLVFGYGSNTGKSKIQLNASGYRHNSDISKAERDFFASSKPQMDPKKEFKAKQYQADSVNILSWASSAQKDAKKKYEEAKKIYHNWQKEKIHMLVDKNGIRKEFFTNAGNLEMYMETKPDGSMIIVGYFPEGPYSIKEINKDGKENNYLFYSDGKLAEFISGKYEKSTPHNHTIVKEEIYSYSNGHLSTYTKNQQTINTFGEFSKGQKDVRIDLKMYFDVIGKKPYLKKAETKTGATNETPIIPKDVFLYDKNGKLIEAK